MQKGKLYLGVLILVLGGWSLCTPLRAKGSHQELSETGSAMMTDHQSGENAAGQSKSKKESPDGYGFRFPAEQSTILLTSEFIARERLCCPFFTIELVAEQEDGPLWLRLRGREGVKAFIKAELSIR